MIEFNLSSISPELLNGIGGIFSAVILALILAIDLMFVILIARTPNKQWEP